MSIDVSEIVSRLEKIERELSEVRQGSPHTNQPPGGGSREPPTKKLSDEVVRIAEGEIGDCDRIVAFTTLEKRPEASGKWNGWMFFSGWRGDVNLDLSKVSGLMESSSNDMRLTILHQVYLSPKYPKELTEITGLTGGALYHHLDVLTETQLVERDKLGRVALTGSGKYFAALVFNVVAQIAHADRKTWGTTSVGTRIDDEEEGAASDAAEGGVAEGGAAEGPG